MDFRRDVDQAARRIAGRVRRTPVERSPALEAGGAAEVWLKLENQQLTGSFKLRGAANKVLSLGEAERRRGLVAASSGNHGAAVACAAAAAGSRALVFVAEGAAASKLAAIRAWGGEIRAHGVDTLEAEIAARRHAAARDMTYVSPYNDPAVVAGQGTVGAELAEQVAELDALFVALGGGGLAAGVGGYLKSLRPGLRLVACSPERSPVMHASLEAGRIVEMESRPTLSDGTAGGVEPGAITFDLCRQLVDESLLLNEAEIRDAVRLVVGRHHTLIEGAAGVAVAGYLARRARYAGRRVAIVLCGANIDPSTLKTLL